MKKYKVWRHYDTGVAVIVTAKNEDEAMEKAEEMIENMPPGEFNKQIYHNLQAGELDIMNNR